MRIDLTGFAPDLDPTTPGILLDCTNVVPTTQGLAAGNSAVSAGFPALAATCSGSYVSRLLDGTKRFFAGTTAAIYEGASLAWTDRSRGGGYTGTNRWRWTTFGNFTLATNRTQAIQVSPSSGAFADIAGAPTASIVRSVAGFVMALDFNNGTDTPDGWHCSGLFDHTVWTPAVSTQCANGRLVDTPGKLTAGEPLGNDFVAYKANSMYLGRYVGAPIIWSWQRIPGDIGCSSAESVVAVQTLHFFVGPSDFYVYDGTVPQSIGAPVREWFFADLNQTYRANIIGSVDVARDLVYWYYPSTASSSGVPDRCLIYNYRKQAWGRGNAPFYVEAVVQYSTGAITYDSLGTLYSTYDNLPNISYDSPFWLADSTVSGLFQTDHILYSLTGTPGASTWLTGVFGDETSVSYLSRVTPRFRSGPSSASYAPYAANVYKSTLGDAGAADGIATFSRYRFDFHRSAHWHQINMFFGPGAVGIDRLDVQIESESED